MNFTEFLIREIPFIAIYAGAIYWFWFRPRQTAKRDALINQDIRIGDEVVSAEGMIGTVVNLGADLITIESGSRKDTYSFTRENLHYDLSARKRYEEMRKKK